MSETPVNLRTQIDEAIAAGDATAAAALLAEFWRGDSSGAGAGFVVGRFEKLRDKLPLTRCKLTILRSFTVEPVVPLLRAMAFVAGIDLTVQIGDFNTYAQEIIDPNSKVYEFTPDVVILAAQARDLAPPLWDRFADLEPAEVEKAVEQTIANVAQLAQQFRQRSQAALVIHTLERPTWPAMGVLDGQIAGGQSDAIDRINRGLRDIASKSNHTYLLDYGALVARRGVVHWDDARKWLTARLPIASNEMIHLAREWMRFLHPLTGKVAKVLAVDLDNTLWGGVIGEDGIDGIKLSADYPGAAFQHLQRVLLDLYRRGVLLALCSKNNLNDAMEVFKNHRGMLLKPEHFAAMRVNWEDKASNLRQIAKDLNLGIDAVAFLDDNPVERRWVRSQLPEVAVIDLPDDPMKYADAVRAWPVFERLRLTEEDRQRAKFYAQDRQRDELQQSTGSLEDFYRSLQMKVKIGRMTQATMPRVAQLTQKTNQFNVTTRRYSEQQVTDFGNDPAWRIYTLTAEDRFGDNGLVGLAMLKFTGDVCEIDTLLLSCRVIGRTIETAFLATLANAARSIGATKLVGCFIPTKKNAPAKEFFAQHGFTKKSEENGTQWWELSLAAEQSVPQWIDVSFVP